MPVDLSPPLANPCRVMGCRNYGCNEKYEKHDNFDLVSREAHRWPLSMTCERTGSDSMPFNKTVYLEQEGRLMFKTLDTFMHDSILTTAD